MASKGRGMIFVDACRTPLRRKIVIAAEEMERERKTVTVTALSRRLGVSLGSLSYHVQELAKAGVLEVEGGEQRRGAWQKHYKVSGAFRASTTDSVALDQIAELIDGTTNGQPIQGLRKDGLVEIVRATGRPVEA